MEPSVDARQVTEHVDSHRRERPSPARATRRRDAPLFRASAGVTALMLSACSVRTVDKCSVRDMVTTERRVWQGGDEAARVPDETYEATLVGLVRRQEGRGMCAGPLPEV